MASPGTKTKISLYIPCEHIAYSVFLYVVTPDPAIQTITVCKHSVLRLKSRLYLCLSSFSSQAAVALLRDSCTVYLEAFFIFLDQPDRVHSKEKQQ